MYSITLTYSIKAQKETHTNAVDLFLAKERRHLHWRKVVFSANGAGTTGHAHAKKKESRHRPHSLQNNELNMNHRTKSKTQNHKFQSVT